MVIGKSRVMTREPMSLTLPINENKVNKDKNVCSFICIHFST